MDEHLLQRAAQVNLAALPVVNMIGSHGGSKAIWGRGYNVLSVWKERMHAKCQVPTAKPQT